MGSGGKAFRIFGSVVVWSIDEHVLDDLFVGGIDQEGCGCKEATTEE